MLFAVKGRKAAYQYLLSDHVGIMAGFDFEGAVVGPQVNGIRNTGNTSLVDLFALTCQPTHQA